MGPRPAPGFFGKVPARGDFLSRRLPPGFAATWEDWLAAFTVSAREALAAEWPAAWLTAPLWHFRLGGGLARPDGAAGVLIASADRVGRFFPFSIFAAAAISAETAPQSWSREIETLCVAALDDGFSPDALEAALAELGAPPAIPAATRPDGVWRIELRDDWPEAVGELAIASGAPGALQSSWWCRGSDRVPPSFIRCTGMPGAALCSSMVTGRFQAG